MDWKDDLFDYFTSKNIFRIKYLNDMLHIYLKEYVNFLNEFNDSLIAKYNETYSSEVPGIPIGVIEIIIRTDKMNEEFSITSYFNKTGQLCIKYSDDYDYNAELKHITGKNSDVKKDFHKYEEEEFDEPEKIEKEYIFQLFNNRLKSYIDKELSKLH